MVDYCVKQNFTICIIRIKTCYAKTGSNFDPFCSNIKFFSEMTLRSLSATFKAPSKSVSGSVSKNSSPPYLASKSTLSLMESFKRFENSFSTRSPAWWPYVSFTFLKQIESFLPVSHGDYFVSLLYEDLFQKHPYDYIIFSYQYVKAEITRSGR